MNQTLPSKSSAFSLTEILAVMAIGSILMAIAMPALRGVTAASISTGVKKTNDLLTQTRSEAIVRQLPCRLAVVTNWPSNQKANFRALSIWRANPQDPTLWEQITTWNYLPEGSVFDPNAPSNPPTYNSGTPQFVFDAANNEFSPNIQGETVTMRFVEFLPSGAARTPGGVDGENLYVRIAEGTSSNSGVQVRSGELGSNFADLVADGLIGRIKTYRQ